MMDMLSPHLSANLRRTVDAQVVSALGVDDDAGLLILDKHARVLYCNPFAERVIMALRSGTGRPAADDIVDSAMRIEGQMLLQTDEGRYTIDTKVSTAPDSDAARIITIHQTHDDDTLYAVRLRARFGFSERETEVLVAVMRGHRNRDIAQHLAVSEHTVKKHIQNMARKANVGSRTALVHAALQVLDGAHIDAVLLAAG
jgi:DNA-binding CsgD family transcriptional regulator